MLENSLPTTTAEKDTTLKDVLELYCEICGVSKGFWVRFSTKFLPSWHEFAQNRPTNSIKFEIPLPTQAMSIVAHFLRDKIQFPWNKHSKIFLASLKCRLICLLKFPIRHFLCISLMRWRIISILLNSSLNTI